MSTATTDIFLEHQTIICHEHTTKNKKHQLAILGCSLIL